MRNSRCVHSIRSVSIVSVVLLVLSLFAVSTVRADEAGKGKSFLWEVKSDTTTIYLLGSVHAMKPTDYPLNPAFYKAFEKASKLVVEIDITKVDQAKIMQAVMKDGMYKDPNGLKNDLGPETYQAYMAFLQKNQLPAGQFGMFKPGMAWMTMATMKIMKLGYSVNHGIDIHFIKKAHEKKMPVLALEKMEDQLSLFLGGNLDSKMLIKYVMRDWDNTEAMMNTIMKAWHSGDAKQMQASMVDDTLKKNPEIKPILKAFLFDRNLKMAEKVDGYLKTNDVYFVIAGAGHMVGETGLVEQMKKKGYQVTQK